MDLLALKDILAQKENREKRATQALKGHADTLAQ